MKLSYFERPLGYTKDAKTRQKIESDINHEHFDNNNQIGK